MKPSIESLFRSAYRIRRTEEEIARIYPTDDIKSPVHLAIGQETVAVGVCAALRPEDVVFGTYRSHALYLAKGGDLKKMMAELFGKATGCAKGKGGSMHLVDAAHGVMGTSAVVATTIPLAIGYAYATKLRREARVIVSFFGDGAVEEGVFHESLNFAALKKLPVLFVCENNFYAIHTHQRDRQPLDNIHERAHAYGIPAARVEDGDVLSVWKSAANAVKTMRATGSGPFLIECLAYRWKEHVGPAEDWALGYRAKAEAEPWLEKDICARLGSRLPRSVREQIEIEVEAEIRDAVKFAEESPFPEPRELYTDLFGDA